MFQSAWLNFKQLRVCNLKHFSTVTNVVSKKLLIKSCATFWPKITRANVFKGYCLITNKKFLSRFHFQGYAILITALKTGTARAMYQIKVAFPTHLLILQCVDINPIRFNEIWNRAIWKNNSRRGRSLIKYLTKLKVKRIKLCLMILHLFMQLSSINPNKS